MSNLPQRAMDAKSYYQWLEALQGTIVLRRQDPTSTKPKSRISRTSLAVITSSWFRKEDHKSEANNRAVTCVNDIEFEESKGKKENLLSRRSLHFIPGHGKKYSTYDSNRSYLRTETVDGDWNNIKTIDNVEIEIIPETSKEDPNVKKRGSKKPRPISESVSDFLLLNTPSTENVDKNDVKDETADTKVRGKKFQAHSPRIPKSIMVGKLLSHIEGTRFSSKRASRSLSNLSESLNSVDSKQRHNSQTKDPVEGISICIAKSDDVLAKRTSNSELICHKSIPEEEEKKVVEIDVTCAPQSKEDSVTPVSDKATVPVEVLVSESSSNKKIKKKDKDSSRRKSGLAMIRQFFTSAKIGLKKKETGDKLTVDTNQSSKNSSRKTSTEKVSAKSSARSSQTFESTEVPEIQEQPTKELPEKKVLIPESALSFSQNIQDVSPVSVHEEIFTAKSAYVYEARVVAVIEPGEPIIPSTGDEVDSAYSVENLGATNSSIPFPVQTARNSGIQESILQEKNGSSRNSVDWQDSPNQLALEAPTLPVKTKLKCPSPGYDIPRTKPIPVPGRTQIGDETLENFESFPNVPWGASKRQGEPKESDIIRQIDIETANETRTFVPVCDETVSAVFPNQHLLPSVQQAVSLLNPINNTDGRLSFALAETEVVQEETVRPISEGLKMANTD